MAVKEVKKGEVIVKRMYIGPNIGKFGIASGTIYNGYPENVKAAIKEYKEIEALFIVIDDKFPTKKGNIKISGTKENILYKKIKELIGGKK